MKPRPEHVTVVASSAETLDGLQAYLSRAGLNVRGTRKLEMADADPCSAIVYFPDDFATEDVLRELHRLSRRQPRVLSLLVTSEPQRYSPIAETGGEGPAPSSCPNRRGVGGSWTLSAVSRLRGTEVACFRIQRAGVLEARLAEVRRPASSLPRSPRSPSRMVNGCGGQPGM